MITCKHRQLSQILTSRPKVEVFRHLGKTKVCDDDVSLTVEQQVLGLEVPVGDGEGVEVLESGDDLGRVEERRRRGETSCAAQIREELASADVWEEKVEEA